MSQRGYDVVDAMRLLHECPDPIDYSVLLRVPPTEADVIVADAIQATALQRIIIANMLELRAPTLPNPSDARCVASSLLKSTFEDVRRRAARVRRDARATDASVEKVLGACASFMLEELGPDVYDALYPNGFVLPPDMESVE